MTETLPPTTGAPTYMPRTRKRRRGDRKDGRRLRSLNPLNRLMPYIMNTDRKSVV